MTTETTDQATGRYTIDSAAERAGLSPRTIRQLIYKGKLPADKDVSENYKGWSLTEEQLQTYLGSRKFSRAGQTASDSDEASATEESAQ